MHAMARFPTGQAFVSSGRLVKGAKESAGHRFGTSGNKIGNAHLQWAFAAAAGLCLRHTSAGQHDGARVEQTHGQGNALTILAHTLARAVYDRLKRQTACDMEQCLHGEGSRGGEPEASLDLAGSSL